MEVEKALEKLKMTLPFKEDNQVPSALEVPCSKRIKPRALVFKANDKDLHKIKELIETQFPDVEILYVTTGPAKSFLHVTKSIPFEMQGSSEHPFYTIEQLWISFSFLIKHQQFWFPFFSLKKTMDKTWGLSRLWIGLT